jgi:hypothetical protein
VMAGATFERVRSPFWTTETLTGSVYPAARRAVVSLQLWSGKRWHTVARVRVGSQGTYRARLAAPGSYRVLYNQIAGPTVTTG